MDFKNERLMMSEEEVRNRAKELLNENQVDLITKYMFLEQQAKKQKEVINKAIKYIDDLRDESAERQGFYNCFPDDLYIPNIKELLDILKEVKNEN